MVTRYDLGWRAHEIEASPTGDYVKHMDYAALEARLRKVDALLDAYRHGYGPAFEDALSEAQITGLAFIRVNANGHVQALPSDRVRISVIQAVEERTAAATHHRCDHLWVVGPSCGPVPEYFECVKCREQKPLGEGVCE